MTHRNPPEPQQPEQDAAITRRLARLGHKAVETEDLKRRLDTALGGIDHDEPVGSGLTSYSRSYRLTRWLQPAAGLAAIVAVVITLLFAFSTNPPTASAAVVRLSDLHRQVEIGGWNIPAVASLDAVNEVIAQQRAGGVDLPDDILEVRVQSCCLVDVQGDLLALAVLQDGEPTVSFVVAQSEEFAHEMGTVIEIDGRRFFGHELSGVRMMMANDQDRWICVMGDRSYEALAQLAAGVRF